MDKQKIPLKYVLNVHRQLHTFPEDLDILYDILKECEKTKSNSIYTNELKYLFEDIEKSVLLSKLKILKEKNYIKIDKKRLEIVQDPWV